MNKIIIANWKQNPQKASEAKKIVVGVKKLSRKLKASVVICPPAPFLSLFTPSGGIYIGAQDVSTEKEGAHTGEVSVSQLRSVGVTHVIVGHSERREMGETSEVIAKKTLAILKAKMTPIVCIGEKERHEDASHWGVISREIHASLAGIPRALASRMIIAYEPIWAIGSASKGAMKPEDVGESAIFIKKVVSEIYGTAAGSKIRVIYGGSVDDSNAGEIGKASGVSGFLVGRQSLKPKSFIKIAEALK